MTVRAWMTAVLVAASWSGVALAQSAAPPTAPNVVSPTPASTLQPSASAPIEEPPPPPPHTGALPKPVDAESHFQYELEVEVGSDYVFRGIDQTDHRLAGQLDGSVSYKSFYVGFNTANIDYRPFGDHQTGQELDGYLGYKDEAFGFTYDVGVIAYNYINQPGGLNYGEAYVRGSREIGPIHLGASFYFDPNVTRARRGDVYGEGEVGYTFARKWTVSAAVGHGSGQANYLNWNVGATYALNRRISLDLRYSDTEAHDQGPAYDGRVIASIKLRLP